MLLYAAGATDPLLILLLALALDLAHRRLPALWRVVPHPVAWVGSGGQLARPAAQPRAAQRPRARRVRGALAVLLLAARRRWRWGWRLTAALRILPFGWAMEAGVVAVLLAQRACSTMSTRWRRRCSRMGSRAGRAAVAHIVGRDPDSLDEHGVARAAIESLAENFSDGVVAPALWYALLGLPGIFLYKTANTLDSMIGHRSPRYLQFGWAAARLDDAAELVPARLAGAAARHGRAGQCPRPTVGRRSSP